MIQICDIDAFAEFYENEEGWWYEDDFGVVHGPFESEEEAREFAESDGDE